MIWDDEEVEFTIEDSQDKCQDCKFYLMIDSGFGRCRRFPPKAENIDKWWKPKWRLQYQLVEWCRRACGEFAHRHIREK